ncbi:nucleoside diphosphate kinase regulator [Taklimakanibacter deserti]|jgi:regulator of nucleoside diphosphate kinase|uniref:nucleoside diphosphate kinase regulator n=1 Tax=Taklimakanibacter deserti TaxID=2267839 RepID=UPI000E645D9E
MDTNVVGQAWQKPVISISASDHARLMKLADSIATGNAPVADDLFGELERANIVADNAIANDIVRMGSCVRFEDEKGTARIVTLVFPGEADIAEGRLSILTPVGTALIGLTVGQSILWTGRDGQQHRLTVLAVT